MRTYTLAAAAALTLSACGGSHPASAPTRPTSPVTTSVSTPSGSRSAALPAKPRVTVLPYALQVGVGRAALINDACAQAGSDVCAIVAGGLVVGDNTTDVVQLVDFTSGKVTRLPSLAVPVHDTAGGISLVKAPLVIGGGNATEQSAVQQFDGTSWRVVSHLPTTRSDLSALQSGDGLPLVLGGYDGVSAAVRSVLTGDGTTWHTVGSLAVPLRYTAAAHDPQMKVWLFGGESAGRESDVVQTFDPASGKGEVVAHLPMPVGHMSAIAVGSRFLVMGGRTDASSGAMTDRMWWFDPATVKFTDAGRLPAPVADAMIVGGGASGDIYLIGGESPHPIKTILQIKVTP